MRIKFINNDGGGFAEYVEVPDGTSVEDLLRQQGVTDFSNYNIRYRTSATSSPMEVAATQILSDGNVVSAVARPGTTPGSTILTDGARVSVMPKNIGGAL